MKVVNIIISGQIGSYTDETGKLVKGVDLIDVIAQAQTQKVQEADEVHVKINSPGGIVGTGFDIYDYLVSLKKPITTIIEGQCASMATIIALAGSKRQIIQGSEFLIHNPWINNVSGDASTMTQAAEMAKAEEDKMVDFYAKHTSITKDGLAALMKLDEPMSIDMALKLGFVTEVISATGSVPKAIKAFALVKQKSATTTNKKDTMKKFKESVKNLLAELKIDSKKFFGADDATDDDNTIALTLADGTTISVADPDGDGIPMTGDVVTDSNGAPCPNATFTTGDGAALTTDADSKVLTYTPATAQTITDDAAFVEQVKQALEGSGIDVVTFDALKTVEAKRTAIVSALKNVTAQKKAADQKAVFAVKKRTDFETSAMTMLAKLKDEIKSNYKPAATLGFGNKLDKEKHKETASAIESFRESRKKRFASK